MKKVTTQRAAAIMKKSVQFVRCVLQAGKFPFGTAVKCGRKYTYYISPKGFMEYTGCTLADIECKETDYKESSKI